MMKLVSWIGLACLLGTIALRADALATRRAEIAEKESRLRALLAERQLDGVLIGTQRNFAWLTAGGDSHVVFNAEEGSAWLLWMPDSRRVIVANNEERRIQEEELAGLGYEAAVFSWHEDLARGARLELLKSMTAGLRIGGDLPVPGLVPMGPELDRLRAALTAGEIARYRELAAVTAGIVEDAARNIQRGQTEREIQATVARGLLAEDILPTVLLVAADDRIAGYRHAITKNQPVRREAMITVCARKWGLVVAVTRHVHFGALPEETGRRQEALGQVYAAMLAATQEGVEAGRVIGAAREAYERTGHGAQWDGHHLGGAIGYRERDYKAQANSSQRILRNQAFAWNPTLAGVKAEDTVLVGGSALEILTDTGRWPRRKFESGGRVFFIPQILIQE